MLSRHLEWGEPREYHHYLDESNVLSGSYLFFEGAGYFNSQTLLPYYHELIPFDQDSNYELNLVNKRFVELTPEEEINDKARRVVNQNMNIVSGLRFDRNQPFIQLQFVPLRKNPVSGNIEKLVHFDISLKSKPEKKLKHEESPRQGPVKPSILSEGRWVKIGLDKDGIYKIGYSQLKDMGFTNPGNVGVYGNNSCGLLSTRNDKTEQYRLEAIPVRFEKGSNNLFDRGDYLLFYGRGPHVWDYDPEKSLYTRKTHLYTSSSFYYITNAQSEGNRLVNLAKPASEATEVISSFPDYIHHEKRNRNLIKSGREWVGEYFDVRLQYQFDINFPNVSNDQSVKVAADFVARSSYESSFVLRYGEEEIIKSDIPDVNYSYTSHYARSNSGYGEFLPGSDRMVLTVEFQKGTPSAEGWLNYFTVNAQRELIMSNDQMHFRYNGSNDNKVVEFNLSNAPEDAEIWEVTRGRKIRRVGDLSREDGNLAFKVRVDSLSREFIAFGHQGYYTPSVLGTIDNQNLHGLAPQDMLVVTKEEFQTQAERVADLHRQADDFNVSVVTDKEIYNEFSSGKPDPSAIRNFVRMLYNKATGDMKLKYLLLFGDGSYDNWNSGESPNLITYQSANSYHYARSFVSDDFFGLLDPSDYIEGSPSGLIDIGIGRFPVNDRSEATEVVDKVERYIDSDNWGSWLNKICFVADDEDNNLHMRDADRLARYVTGQYPQFNVGKIYFDAYKQQNIATGSVYPEVSEAINENINNGILLFNYTGHGGERQLAHERILEKEDIENWTNTNRLPLFMTATCEFTRFDDPGLVSAGEEVFLKPDGGSIASFSTTRIVYASLNFDLNSTFYQYVFSKDSRGENMRFGDIVRLTKNYAGSSNNKRNFSLFGDPALKMLLGEHFVRTDSIVANDTEMADTIHALDKITLYGKIVDATGQVVNGFGGSLHLKLLDKLQSKSTLANDGGEPFNYQARDNILFSGESKVSDGSFTSEFIVPREVLPAIAKGKMLYFGKDGKSLAQDHYSEFYVGGYSQRVLNDNRGPHIELYMNNEQFVSGGITNENPLLFARLEDSSGINTSSSGIGHNITMTLDKNQQDQYVLNRYYQAEKDSYQKGEVKYRISNLEQGSHQLKLKAWDINGNPSVASIDFTVTEKKNLKITRLINYPNPFTENTAFYFEHNSAGISFDVLIQIFTVSGKIVKTIHRQIMSDGFRAGPIPWNGKDDFGDRIGKGVYLYKIKIRSSEGKTAEKVQKLVILK